MVEMMFIILGVTLLILGLMVVSGDSKLEYREVDMGRYNHVYINIVTAELVLYTNKSMVDSVSVGKYEYLGEL